jgi:hypothetical protein
MRHICRWRSRATIEEFREKRGDHSKPFTQKELTDLTRAIFKAKAEACRLDDDIEEGLRALRLVVDQRKKTECSSCHVMPEHGITVRAMSSYAAEDSKKRGSHLFSYRCIALRDLPPFRLVAKLGTKSNQSIAVSS